MDVKGLFRVVHAAKSSLMRKLLPKTLVIAAAGSMVLTGAAVQNPNVAHAQQFYDSQLEAVEDLRLQYQSTSGGTSYVQNVTDNSENGEVHAYEKFELAFDATNLVFDNPFDPDEVDVIVWFTPPGSTPANGGGDDITVSAFFYDEFSDNNDLYDLTFRKGDYTHVGTPKWKARFSTGIEGTWQYKIRVLKDTTGTKYANATGSFTVTGPVSTKGSRKGYVQVSETNPMWFEHSEDKTLFYGSGTNIATLTAAADPLPRNYNYFLDHAQGTTSATRIWLTNYQWLEWTPKAVAQDNRTHSYGGAGFYNQRVASSLDEILNLAEQYDIKVMLTLDDNNERIGDPTDAIDDPNDSTDNYENAYYNPYLAQNGGPLSNGSFANYYKNTGEGAEVRELYKQRLRYILARWGYSTSLWAINTFNDYKNPNADVADFLEDMHAYIHSITDPWRPIQFSSNYRGDLVDPVLDYAYDQNERETVKPNVHNEMYYSEDGDSAVYQPGLRMDIWPSLMKGNAAGMAWKYWMIENTNSWGMFDVMLDVLSDVPLNKKTFIPTDDVNQNVVVTGAQEETAGDLDGIYRITSVKPYGDIPQFSKSQIHDINFDTGELEGALNKQEVMLEEYTDYLFGANYTYKGQNLHNPPIFTLTPPADGNMILETLRVSSTTAKLAAYKSTDGTAPDGSDQVDINEDDSGALPNGGYRTYSVEQYTIPSNEKYSHIPLTKNVLTKIKPDVPTGSQWVDLAAVHFAFEAEQPKDLVVAKGLVASDEALLYVYNQTHTEMSQSEVLNQDPKTIKNVDIQVNGLLDGEYYVTRIDPATGNPYTENATSSNGVLTFRIYSLGADKVVKIKPRYLLGGGAGVELANDSLNFGDHGDTPSAYSDPKWNWTVSTDSGDSQSKVELVAPADSHPDPALANEKYMRLSKSLNNYVKTSAAKDIDETKADSGTVVIDAMIRPGKNNRDQYGPILVNSSGVELVKVNFNYQSNITVADGDGSSGALMTYSKDQWYNVRVIANLNTGRYTLWIDGTKMDFGSNGYRNLASGTRDIDNITFKLTASVPDLHTMDVDRLRVVNY